MNTEANHESNSAVKTAGERLRDAREARGLSQQAIAERLCLKVSTVRDIEEDKAPVELASTFLRGYIRSYARLVSIPEDELLPMMEKQAPVRASKVAPMQSFSLGKRRKKRDGWLMSFTWLILFVVIGLTGAWWWQNHKAQQAEISQMADAGGVEEGTNDASGNNVPLDLSNQSSSEPANVAIPESAANAPGPTASSSPVQSQPASPTSDNASVTSSTNSTSAAEAQGNLEQPALPTHQADVSASVANSQGMNMAFSADCWLEVTDNAGKKLFSGLKRKGETLDLSGRGPFKLKIGAPAAVTIQYLGNPVDLSRFVRTNQVARLTVGAE